MRSRVFERHSKKQVSGELYHFYHRFDVDHITEIAYFYYFQKSYNFLNRRFFLPEFPNSLYNKNTVSSRVVLQSTTEACWLLCLGKLAGRPMRFLLLKTSQNHTTTDLIHKMGKDGHVYHLDTVDTLLDLSRSLHAQTYNLLFLELVPEDPINHETVESVRTAHPDIPLVVLGNGLPSDEAAKVLKTGADEYFAATIDPQEMEARIEALLRRSRNIAHECKTLGPLQYNRLDRLASINNIPLALSPRETIVLDALMAQPGMPVSKEKLMVQLFGVHNTDSANAVEVYVHRLRRKLVHPHLRIRTLRSNGYVLELVSV